MRKWMTLLVLALALCLPWAAAEALTPTDVLAAQTEIDAMLLAESAAGYDFEQPLMVLNPYGNAPLSAVAIFTTEEALGGMVTVKGHAPEDDITGTFAAGTEHFVPVVGLYAGEVNTVELTLDDGRTATLQVETEPQTLYGKDYQCQMLDASLYDSSEGLTIYGSALQSSFTGFDGKGDLRWMLNNTISQPMIRMDNGHFLILNQFTPGEELSIGSTGIREVDTLGKIYNYYVWDGGSHHDIVIMPNGHYMVASSRPGYDTNQDFLVEIDPATGEVVWMMDMAEVIDPGASGCEDDQGDDWAHINALDYDPETDTLVISCRNINSVVAVERASKSLKWILGDPAGWDEAYASYLLKGDEGTEWSYGQHSVTLLGDGQLLLFDNGAFGRVKMVDADKALADEDNYSRAVIYDIDPEAMTVSQTWEYGSALGYTCYSSFMSNVQVLDEEKGRYLVTFGTCVDDAGEFVTRAHLIENGSCFWQQDFHGLTYRGCRYPIYAEGMYDPNVAGQWHGDLGVTKQVELGDVDFNAAQPAPEGALVDLYPFGALHFYGGFPVEDEALLTDYAVALVGQDGAALGFDLGYTVNRGETIRANLSRWVSLKSLPADTYAVYLVMNGQAYDTGKTVAVE